MGKDTSDLLKKLPSVSKFMTHPAAVQLSSIYGEGLCKLELRLLIEELREAILGHLPSKKSKNPKKSISEIPSAEQLAQKLEQRLLRYSTLGRDAINATGVILHTGLGRAPLPDSCLELLKPSRYSILQVDIDSGGRSIREERIERLLCSLTNCEAVTVVNNNAAATFIVLNAMCAGQEVIISRGQLIEIGGAFRMPEVMARSATILCEVGTTNRTHVSDYESAINENTAAILFVDPSNYHIEGFSGTPSLEELCELGKKHEIPVIADLGSGAIVRLDSYGVTKAITISDALKMGSVVTSSSGDKLIGGPQAGIICGKRDVVENIRKNPFARMFRVDKFTLSALEAALVHYVNGEIEEKIPLYQMLAVSSEELTKRAEVLRKSLSDIKFIECETTKDKAFIGGGSLPDEAIDSVILQLAHSEESKRNNFASRLSRSLRSSLPSIFVRVKEQRVIFDMRTLREGDLESLCEIIPRVIRTEVAI